MVYVCVEECDACVERSNGVNVKLPAPYQGLLHLPEDYYLCVCQLPM